MAFILAFLLIGLILMLLFGLSLAVIWAFLKATWWIILLFIIAWFSLKPKGWLWQITKKKTG